jgi:hypothetical protein
VDVDVDVARAHAHAGRARAYKLINKTTAFYWNVKAEYWYSSRGLPKICMPASCMLMTDAGTHGERVSASPLASGCQRVVVRSLAPWRLIATWKAHLSILTLALSTRSDHISTPPPPPLSRMEIAERPRDRSFGQIDPNTPPRATISQILAI